ncbi:dienelactone hydrolase family protein [Noviherbaspirillum galbum]|uniref:Dienelactone hydrolase family protein n=1 Tax=Noviherbaspirillum galbum TaxID=2709383 RepID=A0A6B3SLD4_9BURK|nr:dienelactone hydrolase family protein [Noviherbaspirillum galbum]NEX61547.1 dienelactone hydrolase family protein [Noviherbaspirillum galbum]
MATATTKALAALLALSMAAAAGAQDQLAAYPGSARVDFASMDGAGPVPLFGWWLPAAGGPAGKRPAVIALHGCGGLYSGQAGRTNHFNARHAAMAGLLHDAGYHVLFPDSLSPRGVRSICTQKNGQRTINNANRRGDVQGALAWLAAQPDVDATRIALLGWSHGGSAVLSSINASNRDVAGQALRPRVAVAFYPGCAAFAKARVRFRNDVPLLLLIGEKDDWTPAAPCAALAEQAAADGRRFILRMYADAYHDFDAPGQALRVRRDVPNGVNPGAGVTVGSNPEAREAAYGEVFRFLGEELEGGR